MPLSTVAKLGPYEILSALVAGGMGEVCRARDARLGRTVAVKVAKTEFSERFTREADAGRLGLPEVRALYTADTPFEAVFGICGAGDWALHDAS